MVFEIRFRLAVCRKLFPETRAQAWESVPLSVSPAYEQIESERFRRIVVYSRDRNTQLDGDSPVGTYVGVESDPHLLQKSKSWRDVILGLKSDYIP